MTRSTTPDAVPAPSQTIFPAAARALRQPEQILAFYAVICLAVLISAPAGVFTVDEAIYLNMARAMAENGGLHLSDVAAIDGAPAILMQLTNADGTRAMPQYPGAYGIIAAPFYAAFGAKGLMALNAIAGAIAMGFTARLGARAFQNEDIGRNAMLILAAASFFPGYALAIWPHMCAVAALVACAYFLWDACERNGARRLPSFWLAGAIAGFALHFRLDSIFVIAALFAWLRLFGAPDSRKGALAFCFGVAPHLLLGAMINFAKFGVFHPFTYGAAEGRESIAAYQMLALLAISAFGASLFFKIDAARLSVLYHRHRHMARRGVLIFGFATMALIATIAPSILRGAFAILVDFQAYAGTYPPDAVTRDDAGFITVYGAVKKALLQSVPYAPLCLLALGGVFSGRRTRIYSLCLLAMAAPIGFFALKGWHGGYSYNMRFFMPVLPFAAVLTASLLQKFRLRAEMRNESVLLAISFGLVFTWMIPTMAQHLAPSLTTPAQTYPALLLCAALIASLIFFGLNTNDRRRARPVVLLSAASLGAAAAMGWGDAFSGGRIAAIKGYVDRAHANAIAPGSLVVTTADEAWSRAAANGVFVFGAANRNADTLLQAVDAFARDQRCVYFHTDRAVALTGVSPSAITPAPIPDLNEGAGYMIYTLATQSSECAFHSSSVNRE